MRHPQRQTRRLGRGGSGPRRRATCSGAGLPAGSSGPRLFRMGLGRPVTVVEAVAIVRSRLDLKREFAEPAKGARGRSFAGG